MNRQKYKIYIKMNRNRLQLCIQHLIIPNHRLLYTTEYEYSMLNNSDARERFRILNDKCN